MAGKKSSVNHGKLHGIRPAWCRPFKRGDPRTLAAAKKSVEVRRAKIARYKSLREAAEALRDLKSDECAQMSNGVGLVAAMYKAAQRGDSKAAAFLAHLLGEMTQRVEVSELPTIIDDIPRTEVPKADAHTSAK